MKTQARITAALLAFWGMVPAAFASPPALEDNSGFVVWSFLGFCALLVLAQVVPAIRNARLTARQERERRASEEAVKAEIGN